MQGSRPREQRDHDRACDLVRQRGAQKPIIDFRATKSGRVRNVDIDVHLAGAFRTRRDMLRAVSPELARGEHLIFCNRYGQPHNPTLFSRQWRERVLAAWALHPDLDELHFHELRHTHATLLLRAGVNPKIVSERLGHADIQTTLNTYSHAVRTCSVALRIWWANVSRRCPLNSRRSPPPDDSPQPRHGPRSGNQRTSDGGWVKRPT